MARFVVNHLTQSGRDVYTSKNSARAALDFAREMESQGASFVAIAALGKNHGTAYFEERMLAGEFASLDPKPRVKRQLHLPTILNEISIRNRQGREIPKAWLKAVEGIHDR